ncbi:MAG: NAD-binding protein [Halanaerobiales bacterium]|nr:NAD-binding protein [Halanaerobiales bacterium]
MKRILRINEKGLQPASKTPQKQIVIVGANDIGIHLAQALGREFQNVFLIDEREEFLRELDEEVDVLTITGNPIALETLKQVGIGEGTQLIAVTKSDAINVLLLLLGQKLGIKRGYALVNDLDYYESFFHEFSYFHGHLHLIHLWELVVQKIEQRSNLEVRILYTDDKYHSSLVAIRFMKGHPMIGNKLKQMKIGNRSRILHVIKKGEFSNLKDRITVEVEDILIIGLDYFEKERVMRRWCHFDGMKKVMVGGDGLNQALKSHWPGYFKGLTCVEKNVLKCQKLLRILEDALILRGDSLDVSLLKEAGIEEASIFLAASENDEVNLLSSLLAKNFGVPEVLTILRRRQHTGMLESLKLDNIISIPQLIVEHLKVRLIYHKSESVLAKLSVQPDKKELEEGLSLVYRAGVLTPLTQTRLREGEEILTLTIN